MARKELKMKPLTDIQGGIAKSIQQGVQDLYNEHAERVDKLLKESDSQSATVRFSVDIDVSTSAPIIDVGIRFTDTITDHRKFSLEDPKQPSLFNQDEGDEKRKAKRDGKKAASGEPDDSGEGSGE